MSTKGEYNNLVRKWGRELANEIMLARARRTPLKKGGRTRGGSPVLPGSFEAGKRR